MSTNRRKSKKKRAAAGKSSANVSKQQAKWQETQNRQTQAKDRNTDQATTGIEETRQEKQIKQPAEQTETAGQESVKQAKHIGKKEEHLPKVQKSPEPSESVPEPKNAKTVAEEAKETAPVPAEGADEKEKNKQADDAKHNNTQEEIKEHLKSVGIKSETKANVPDEIKEEAKKEEKPASPKRKTTVACIIIIIVCLLVAAFCGYKYFSKLSNDSQSKQSYDRIRDSVVSTAEETTAEEAKNETKTEEEASSATDDGKETETEMEPETGPETPTEAEKETETLPETPGWHYETVEIETKEEETEEETEAEPETEPEVEIDTVSPPITVNFQELKEINPDIKGWLYIPCIKLSYPILQGLDNEHYLYYTADNTPLDAGSLFMDKDNTADFSDPNTMIYGHNMKNGTMFGTLYSIPYDNVSKDNPYIWIFTEDNVYRYKIFAAYYADPVSDAYAFFTSRGNTFIEWCKQRQELSEIQVDGVEFTHNSSILTLSTCGFTSELRTIVMGILDGAEYTEGLFR